MHVPQWNGLTFAIINFEQSYGLVELCESEKTSKLLDPSLSRTYHAVYFSRALIENIEMSNYNFLSYNEFNHRDHIFS